MNTKGIGSSWASSCASSKQPSTVAPAASARWFACKITGPSAIGSENGICSSIRSTPASTICRTILRDSAMLGEPSTMCVMSRMSLEARRLRISASSTVRLCFLHDELAPRGIVKRIRDGEDVLVTATRLVDQNLLVFRQRTSFFEGLRERMRGLEGRNDAFFTHGQGQRIHHFAVGHRFEAHATGVLVMRENRRHTDVVEAGRAAVRLVHLPIGGLHETP